MPRARTNQHCAFSVRVDAKRRLRSSAQHDKRRSRVIPGITPAKKPVSVNLRDGMSSIHQRAGIDVYGENCFRCIIYWKFIPLEGLMDRKSTHRKLTLGALVFALPLALGDLQAADNSAPQQTPTFTKDVAPILYANCARCHQPGEIAPMSLLTYEQTRPWAKSIKERVVKRTMPPWFLDKTIGIQNVQERSVAE